jgi:hypothetical protein
MIDDEFLISRKTALISAGVGLTAAALSACTTYGKQPAPAGHTTATQAAAPPTPNVIATTADVPVGSGVIIGDVVLTQPTPGVFKGFSGVHPRRLHRCRDRERHHRLPLPWQQIQCRRHRRQRAG